MAEVACMCEMCIRGRPPAAWRFWRLTLLACRVAYSLGIIAGFGVTVHRGHSGWYVTDVHWRGRRVYILGWPAAKWQCVLLRHHWPYWPGGQPLAFDLCGRCLRCAECGSIEMEHKPWCSEAEP